MIEYVSTFKERFNQILLIRDIKPIDLSKKTGISEATISQYRGGYSKPKDKRLAVIADVLNVNPAWLMGLNVPMNTMQFATIDDAEKWSNSYATNFAISDVERELVVAFRRSDDGTRRSVLKLLDVEIKEKNENAI